MTWVRDTYEALRKIILMDQRLDQIAADVRELAASQEQLADRVARLEGKFELWEAMAGKKARKRRKLPES